MVKLTVAGRINDGGFWRARRAAMYTAAEDHTIDDLDIRALVPADYDLYLEGARKVLGGNAWHHSAFVVCFADGNGEEGYIGDAEAMRRWAFKRTKFVDKETDAAYNEHATQAFRQHILESGMRYCYLGISIGGEPVGNLVFELRADLLPKTCNHFIKLINGPDDKADVPAPYLNTTLHRVVPGAFAQGGLLGDRSHQLEVVHFAEQLGPVQKSADVDLNGACPDVALDLPNFAIKLKRDFEFVAGEAAYADATAEMGLVSQVATALLTCNRHLREALMEPLAIIIEGHCEEAEGADEAQHMALSQARADAVKGDIVARMVTLSGFSVGASQEHYAALLAAKGLGVAAGDPGNVRLRVVLPSEAGRDEGVANADAAVAAATGMAPDGVARSVLAIADECFAVAHDRPGILGFANSGPHTVETQFYVTFAPMPTLNRKYVAIGRLIDGIGTLRKLEEVQTANERPVKGAEITLTTMGKFAI